MESAKIQTKKVVASALEHARDAKYREIAQAQASLVPPGIMSKFEAEQPTPREEAETLGDYAVTSRAKGSFMRRFHKARQALAELYEYGSGGKTKKGSKVFVRGAKARVHRANVDWEKQKGACGTFTCGKDNVSQCPPC